MDKREADRYEAHNSPSVERAISTYLTDEMWKGIRSWARNAREGVSDTTVSSRVINHWEEKMLLPDGFSGDAGWRKFTPVEMAWLTIVSRLRNFGMSLEKIAEVKGCILRWDKETNSYPIFEFHFISAVMTGYDPYIVVFSDGSALFANTVQIETMKVSDNCSDMLLLSLKSVARANALPTASVKNSHLLSGGEPELLAAVRGRENREVNVRVRGGKIDELETKDNYPDISALENLEKTLKKEEAFAEVNVRYTAGNKRSAEVKTRKRIGHQSQ